MPEISDADFELLKLSKAALGKKETRLTTLRTYKTANPDIPIPELDQEERMNAALDPIVKENQKLREDLDKANAMNALKEKRAAITARGLKVEDVEKVMLEKGITSHESAAEFIEANSRVAAPRTASPSLVDRSVSIPQDDGLKKDPAAWARSTAAAVISELQGAKK